MAGLLEEADGLIEDTEAGTEIRDCGLILAAQKVEHYEIATYGGLKTSAGMSCVISIILFLGQSQSPVIAKYRLVWVL